LSAAREHQAAGHEYLELVTTLLQTTRRAHPTAGVWEAADLQWWWRRDQHPDAAEATFWLDGALPVAAVVCMNWGDRIGCDVLGADPDRSAVMEIAWPFARQHIDSHRDLPVEMTICDEDLALLDAVASAGFEPTDEVGVSTWMTAAERPAPPSPPRGFRVVARSDAPSRPHPMIGRNGAYVAERLGECSLYRPELDLAVYDARGEVAGYALFWADPVTGVGLVEPMRTEDEFQRMGIGRLLLAAGLDRLAAHGCSRLKVTYLVGNDASRALYLGAGFHPASQDRTYRRVHDGSVRVGS
jgi:GNAT superfamily N-acetyltransferase